MTPTTKPGTRKQAGGRSKSEAILSAAISVFGEFGYDTTKWSSVADRVGIGQTALYHYFESKAHCLLTIMRLQLERDRDGAGTDHPVRGRSRAMRLRQRLTGLGALLLLAFMMG